MSKLKSISIKREKFFFGLSFDINDFIGDGIWWLQVYDNQQNKIYDSPFAASMNKLDFQQGKGIIRNTCLNQKGILCSISKIKGTQCLINPKYFP